MDDRFEDLVNLYLDKEIGRQELDELKRAIKDNLVRRQQFERACKLHQAARKALVERSGSSPKRGGVVAPASSSRLPSPKERHASLNAAHEQAHVNARVPTMASRQEKQGAAASISIKAAGKKSKATKGHSAAGKQPVRFQSALFLTSVVMLAAGLMYVLNPAAKNPDAPLPVDSTPHYNFSVNPPENGVAGLPPTAAEESIRARVYASVLSEGTVSQSFMMEGLGNGAENAMTGDAGAARSSLFSNGRILLGSSTWSTERWELGQTPASTSLAPSLAPQPPLLEPALLPAASGNGEAPLEVGRGGNTMANRPVADRPAP